MKRSRRFCAVLSLVLAVAVVAPAANTGNGTADAAKKPSLSNAKLTLNVGASKTLKIKNYKKKVAWKSSKSSVAKLSAIKKTSVKVTGKKKGSAKVTASFKLNGKKKKLTCKVTVKEKKTAPPVPVADEPTQPAAVPTTDPNATPSPTPTFDYDAYSGPDCEWKQPGDRIKELFEDYFVAGVSTNLGSLRFGETAGLIRYHFASVTMGNETKPEGLVSVDATDEYPDGYERANVDNYYATNGEGRVILNFDTLEKILVYCKANNIKLRYHTLIWHDQVREYFFLQDFNWSEYDEDDYVANGWDVDNYHKLCDKETMLKRLKDYVDQIFEFIYSHGYGDVVYAFDVINEATNGSGGNTHRYYVNENATSVSNVLSTSGSGPNFQTNGGVRTSAGRLLTSDSSPADVEDALRKNGRTPGNDSYWYATMGADYIYKVFLYAHNAIETNFEKYKDQYGYTTKPSLIYNDYNTRVSDHIGLAKYVNTACNIENGTTGVQYCTGIGLQSHSIAENTQDSMIKAVVDEGLEVQITELDEGADGDQQATKLKNQYNIYKKYSKNGDYGKSQGPDYKGVTSVTLWGIMDGEGSWSGNRIHNIFRQILSDDEIRELKNNEQEVPPFNIGVKPAYYGILQAGGVDCGPKSY